MEPSRFFLGNGHGRALPQNPGVRTGQALSKWVNPWDSLGHLLYLHTFPWKKKHVGEVCDIKVKKSQSPLPRTETLGEPAPLP